jgi:cell division septation protein DedD
MATSAPPAIPSNTTTLDKSNASATTDLYRAAVGVVSTDYYQRIFNRFETSERAGASWNWAAALLTVTWMAFRQLWGAALVYVGGLVAAALLVFGIGRLVFDYSREMEWGLLAALGTVSVVLPGVLGNALLHAASRKRMARALSANATVPEACAMLRREAPSRKRAALLGALNLALLGAAMALYLNLPDASGLPLRTSKMDQARNQVLGKVTDLATRAAAPASPAASAAASTPSAPQNIAPAPSATRAAQGLAQYEAPAQADKPTPPAYIQKSKFYVNVGLFADENNARNAHTKLVDAGLPALQQDVKGTKGKFTRVRVGPLETLAEAETAAEKVRTLGLEAIVLHP